MSMKVAVNGTATFTCRGLGEFIRFEVNNHTINSVLREHGFDDSSAEVLDKSNPDNITRVLRVFGAIDNNGSSIVCVVFRITPLSFSRSDPATLWVIEQGMLHSYIYASVCMSGAYAEKILGGFPVVYKLQSIWGAQPPRCCSVYLFSNSFRCHFLCL